MTLLQITVKDTSKAVQQITQHATQFPIWKYIALSETVLLIGAIIYIAKLKKLQNANEFDKQLNAAKNSTISMDNLMNDIYKAGELYKELSRKYHPDRFVNTDKYSIADELMQNITANKRNYEALLELETKCAELLGKK